MKTPALIPFPGKTGNMYINHYWEALDAPKEMLACGQSPSPSELCGRPFRLHASHIS